jgi:hypothetical protein
MYEENTLHSLAEHNIEAWYNTMLVAHMSCGKEMPVLSVNVYRFVPKGPVLKYHVQYLSSSTSEKQSVPIAIKLINNEMSRLCKMYIEDIVVAHMDTFEKLCWKDEENKFQEESFKLITSCGEVKLMQTVRRLIVATFIMSHTLTIEKVSRKRSNTVFEEFASSRLANRQLKHVFCSFHQNIMKTILKTIQEIFESENGYDNWIDAFVAIIGLCMALEEQQKTLHLVMETDFRTEIMNLGISEVTADSQNRYDELRQAYEARANHACEDIDRAIGLVAHTFCQWSCRSLNHVALESGPRNEHNMIFQFTKLVKANRELCLHSHLHYNELTATS